AIISSHCCSASAARLWPVSRVVRPRAASVAVIVRMSFIPRVCGVMRTVGSTSAQTPTSVPGSIDIGIAQADMAIALGLDQIDEGAPYQRHQYLGPQISAEYAAFLQCPVLRQDRRQRLMLQLAAGLIEIGPMVLQLHEAVGVRRFTGKQHHAAPDLIE